MTANRVVVEVVGLAATLAFPPVSIGVATWIVRECDPPAVVVAVVAISGLALAVAGALLAGLPELFAGGITDTVEKQMGQVRTSDGLSRAGRELGRASDEAEWSSAARAHVRSASDALRSAGSIAEATAAGDGAAERRGVFARRQNYLQAAVWIWTGTLLQGMAAWWAAT